MARAVGIDIGTEAIRGVLVESRHGKLQILSAGATPLGEWAVLDDNQDKRLAIGEKLKELVRSAGLRAPLRRVTATMKGSVLRYLSVPPVPPWRLEMLAKYEIEVRADDKEASAYDYRILDVPDISGQYTVMLGSMHERNVNWLMDISRQARMGEVEPDLKAIALYNAYYHGYGYDKDKTVLIVDIGAEEITVLVVRDGALYLARTFEGGGRRISQALSEELKATILEAEEIKKNEAEILFDVTAGATVMMRRSGRVGAVGAAGVAGASTMRRPPNGASKETQPAKPGGDPAVRQASPSDGARPALLPDTDVPSALPSQAPPVGLSPAAGAAPVSLPVQPTEVPVASGVSGPLRLPTDIVVPVPGPDGEGEKRDDLDLQSNRGAPLPPEVEAEKRRRPLSAGDQAFLDEMEDLQPGVKRRKQISQVLVRESAGLCAALENALNYCRGQYKLRELKIDAVYMTGAGSRLKGLAQLVSRRMRAPVETLDIFRQLDLSRLPKEAEETLRAEQDRMAVSTGLALSSLCSGAFSFLLWPSALKEKKEFWARGAYLYYAAVFLLALLAVFFLTPYRNAETLASNDKAMQQAVQDAQRMEVELAVAEEVHEELQRRLEQIDLNARSGAFFLKVLAELKDPNRIPQDVWLTSISTHLPSVILKDSGSEPDAAVAEPGAKPADPRTPGITPDTFQAQARLYLRGFVRSGQKDDLYDKIKGDRTKKPPFIPGFSDRLVPYPDVPEDPRNLFRDVRPVWVEKNDHPDQSWYLKEFVLEAYVEGSRQMGKGRGLAGKSAPPAEKKGVEPGARKAAEPAPGGPAEKKAAEKKPATNAPVRDVKDPEPKAF